VDSISSELVDDYYKDDPDLKRKRRVTAIVGASYLLHLRATEPDRMGEGEQRLLDKLLTELDVPADAAVELLKELEEHGTEDLLGLLEEDSSEEE
jgi:hypothetical protein